MKTKITTSAFVFSLLFLMLSGWTTNNGNTITDFYYYKDKPYHLNLIPDKIYFKLNQPVSRDEFRNLLGHYENLLSVLDYKENEKRQIVNLNQMMSEANIKTMLTNLKSSNLFQYVSPVYSGLEGLGNPETLIGVEDEIIVQFKSYLTDEQINSIIQNKNLNFVQRLDLSGGKTFVLKVPMNTFTIEVANEVYESGFVNYSEPDFFLTNMLQYIPNDTYFSRQWSLRNLGSNIPGGVTGTPGCDMRLDSAWNITRGESYVKIGIIDTGIDTLHEDLASNMVPNTQYDFINNDPYADDQLGHGTCCAGIAAGAGNNSIGISGVAPNSKMIAVKIISVSNSLTHASAISGLIWALQKGAWVCSCPWGRSGFVPNSGVDNAILDGITMGRNGKGMIFCFAAGNENSPSIGYPASNPNGISVGGVSPCNQRKSPTSCDGENWWGANYGAGLDVVAPCVKVFTTDITGGPGDPSGGIHGYSDTQYDTVFNGTSAATPNVAGVCALMLSLDSNLTWDSVRTILNKTADKVGPYSYNTAGPLQNLGNTWNNEMGYGKVNAYNALQYVYYSLGPFFTHTSLLSTENITGPYAVNSVITSINGSIDPLKTKLFWTRGVLFDSIPMANSGGNNWTANIPGNGSNALYKYYMKSTDITGVERILPYGAPDIYFSFTASTDSSELLLSPLNNSVNNPIPLNLKWRRRANATNYLLQVATDSLLSNLLVNDSTIIDTIKNISLLDTNKKYYWKVTVKQNAAVIFSSTIWKFTTGATNLTPPTYILIAKNFSLEDSLADDDMLKFDIYIQHTNPPAPFQYAGGQYFLSFNNAIATSNSDLQYSIIGSDLPANLRPRNPTVGSATNPSANVLRLGANIFPGAGNGYIMTNNGYPGTKIASMRLRRISGTFNTQYFSLAWRDPPITTQQTKITAFIGVNPIDITNPLSHSIDSSGLSGVLPIELTSFTSSVSNNNVTLDWMTQREINNSGFDVEKSNVKGQTSNDWKKIGYVQGNGTTSSPMSYEFTDRALSSGRYKYRLKQIDFNGNFEYYDLLNEVVIGVPDKFSLQQNYPNPFNPKTIINYELPITNYVSLIVYNVLGSEITTLVNKKQDAGSFSVEFDASNFSSGIYFYKLSANGFTETKRMILLK